MARYEGQGQSHLTETPSPSSDQDTSQASASGPSSGKPKGRKFFQKAQPTFSVAAPVTQLEFLDNSDPSKDAIVRKKAREWVYRNKELTVRKGNGGNKTKAKAKKVEGEGEWQIETVRTKKRQDKIKREYGLQAIFEVSDPLANVGAARFDPFNTFPAVGRKIDHIIEYFLTSCPEEVPCSDDKYAYRPQQSLIKPARENSILGNMAGEYCSFVLWLHATTLIRDGMVGRWDSEEAIWYYKLSLKVMQEASKRKVEEYTDEFISSMACFAACANFAGMFEAAVMHRNAFLKCLTLRGKGDLIQGLLSLSPWVRKAIQWCEFGVAAQLSEISKFGYMPPALTDPLPYSILSEADRRTTVTLSSLPPISEDFFNIFRWLHQLALSQIPTSSSPANYLSPGRNKIDPSVLRPLYDAESSILKVLSAQKEHREDFTDVEVMLAEACQLFFWTGPRGLPPEMRMCALFVARLKSALIPVLNDHPSDEVESVDTPPPMFGAISEPSTTPDRSPGSIGSVYSVQIIPATRKLDNAITWALFLGTLVSSVHSRPEYPWFRKQLRMHMQAIGLNRSREDLQNALMIFPYTQGFCYLGIHKLNMRFDT